MTAPRTYAKPECAESIYASTASFISRERQRQGLKSAEIARRLGRKPKHVRDDLSSIQCGNSSKFGFSYLFRIVEALGYDIEIQIVPRKSSRRIAA